MTDALSHFVNITLISSPGDMVDHIEETLLNHTGAYSESWQWCFPRGWWHIISSRKECKIHSNEQNGVSYFLVQNLNENITLYALFTICVAFKKYALLKVAYTSGPIFEKIMKRYPIFSVQIINYQINQKHK